METTLTHRVTFAQFMEQALYGPAGYYASGQARSGREGDYFTAPDVGPVFGRLLSEIFVGWQRQLGFTPFHLIEAGAGEGALAQSIRRDVPYTAIERSPARREKLKSFGVNVLADISDLQTNPLSGILFANELLDAFPVHRLRMHNHQLQEAYVEDGHLDWGIPSTPRLAAYLDRLHLSLPDDYETEINLAMAEWFRAAAAGLKKGLVLLIDYGRPAHEYYAPERTRGTLRSFRGHRVDGNVLAHPGFADLTADVDFTSAALDAQDAGFTPLAFMEMGSFLMSGVEKLPASEPAPKGLKYLIHPDGMGSQFHVLILGKDIPLSPKDFPHNRLSRLGL